MDHIILKQVKNASNNLLYNAYTFFTCNQLRSNLCSDPRKVKQLLRLRYNMLLTNVFAFFIVYSANVEKFILSNFVPQIREKIKQLLRLWPVSGCLLKKCITQAKHSIYHIICTASLRFGEKCSATNKHHPPCLSNALFAISLLKLYRYFK